MADDKGRPIPTSTKSAIPHHWWFDPRQTPPSTPPSSTAYPNSPTESFGSSYPASQSPISSSPDSKGAATVADHWNKWRRDSLKNFYHLDDFATPE